MSRVIKATLGVAVALALGAAGGAPPESRIQFPSSAASAPAKPPPAPTPSPPAPRPTSPPASSAKPPVAAMATHTPSPATPLARRFPPAARPATLEPAPAAAVGDLPAGTPIPPAALEAFVDGAVRASMASQHIAGVAVAVVQNGQVVLTKGYGLARLDPATPVDANRTLFRLGGITQTFTWIALMKEVESGQMRPGGPVNLYLPEKLQIPDQGFRQPIQLRDLLTHSAGFEDRALGQQFERDPARIRPLAEYLRQERPRRVREAGATPVFSDYGAALAGAAVAYVNGHRYQDIVDSEIIRPLGLIRTTVREPYPARPDLPEPMSADLAHGVSEGYRWGGGRLWPQGFEYATQAAPAAAASSTAADMARYLQLILGGGQLDGAGVYRADTAQGFRTTAQASAPGVNGWDDGFLEFSLPGGHRGHGALGDTLWFHSSLVTVPDLNLGVFVATNTDTGSALAKALPGEIVAQFYTPGPPPPRAGSPDLPGQASTYAGTYLDERRAYSGLEKFARMLSRQIRVSVTDDGRLLVVGGFGGLWTPDGAQGRFVGVDRPETLAFDVSDGERARRLFAPSGATVYDRMGLLHQAPTLALLAALAAIASIATIVGVFTRDRRDFRQTPTQARAGLMQNTIAVLWLLALTAFGFWCVEVGDAGVTMYGWPGPWLLIGSACALVATLLTFVTILMAPMVWRGGRRLDSWTAWRKLRFTLSTLVFAVFGFTLMLWGALEPWSG